MTIRAGLCSVTFRQLSAERVIELAVEAGLSCIEWGSDVHVPVGDLARADDVFQYTEDAGLSVASYGSYFRAMDGEDIRPVVDTARSLGADRIRIWAGTVGSAEASDEERTRITANIARAAEEAHYRGLAIALEYHGGTLADTPESTLGLIESIDIPSLQTYWQPTVGASDEQAVSEYRHLGREVSALHVFSWWPTVERHPLHERDDLWRPLFRAALGVKYSPRDALLEFVPGDDPSVLAREAEMLRRYLALPPAAASAD